LSPVRYRSKVKLLDGNIFPEYDCMWQMASFGPVLATKMSISSTLSLPWGLGAAGAETVKQAVDSDNAEGEVRTLMLLLAVYSELLPISLTRPDQVVGGW
jgi:hypothetical protein